VADFAVARADPARRLTPHTYRSQLEKNARLEDCERVKSKSVCLNVSVLAVPRRPLFECACAIVCVSCGVCVRRGRLCMRGWGEGRVSEGWRRQWRREAGITRQWPRETSGCPPRFVLGSRGRRQEACSLQADPGRWPVCVWPPGVVPTECQPGSLRHRRLTLCPPALGPAAWPKSSGFQIGKTPRGHIHHSLSHTWRAHDLGGEAAAWGLGGGRSPAYRTPQSGSLLGSRREQGGQMPGCEV